MTFLKAGVLAALALGAVATSASAQQNLGAQVRPPPPPRPPPVLIDPYNRGPPAPPDRAWPPPRPEISPPMERTPQIAPLAPRVGN